MATSKFKTVERLKAFLDTGAWSLVLIGLILFVARIPLAPGGFINLPVAATVVQTAGLMFTIAGLQIFVSKMVWPDLSFTALIAALNVPQLVIQPTIGIQVQGEAQAELFDDGPRHSPLSAAIILAGLMVYNGLSTIAFVWWLSSAMGAQLGA